MSLYSSSTRSSKAADGSRSESIFHLGFIILAISGLLKAAENCIYLGLHSESHWNRIDWGYWGFMNLMTISFAVLFLRYLSKSYHVPLVWTSFILTIAGWIAYLAFLLSASVHGLPAPIATAGKWGEGLGHTGSPVGCILFPFMQGSRASFHMYLFYVVNADYMIKLVFFGICIMKYPQKQVAQQTDRQGLRHTAHA